MIPPPVMATSAGGSGVLGTQEIVNIIRGKGASNLIVVPGIIYSGNIRRWEQYKPTDSMPNKLVVSKHNYSFGPGVAGDACRDPDDQGPIVGDTTDACKARFEEVARAPAVPPATVGPLVSDTRPVIVTETGTSWEKTTMPPDPGDPATDGTVNVLSSYNPSSGLCQNQVYVPFILNYVRNNLLAGYNFHDATAIREPAIGFPPNGNHPGTVTANRPCQNFQLFMDYGEGFDADGVLDNGGTMIEPTKYGVVFKTINQTFDWVYDTTPNPFSFPSVSNVARNSVQTSASVTITGINAPTPISVNNGSYSIKIAPSR